MPGGLSKSTFQRWSVKPEPSDKTVIFVTVCNIDLPVQEGRTETGQDAGACLPGAAPGRRLRRIALHQGPDPTAWHHWNVMGAARDFS